MKESDWMDITKAVFNERSCYDEEILFSLIKDQNWASLLFWPYLSNYLESLHLSIKQFQHPIDSVSIASQLSAAVIKEAEQWGQGLFSLQSAIYKLENDIQVECDSDFDDFIQQFKTRDTLYSILSEYPILLRQATLYFDQRKRNVNTLLARLSNDRFSIFEAFGLLESDPLQSIETDAGDSHNGGQTVAILQFKSGFKLVYKPRSISVDAAFCKTLDWLSSQLSNIPLLAPNTLECQQYGWVQFIASAPCRSLTEVRSFYRKQGAHIALLMLFGGNDIHNENVIANGEFPVLIDLETLFSPRIPTFEGMTSGVQRMYESSVLSSGMLPFHLSLSEGGSIERGGLAGEGGKLVGKQAYWKDTGCLSMQLSEQTLYSEEAQNLPYFDGKHQRSTDFIAEILCGFRDAYLLLLRKRDLLLSDKSVLTAFKHAQIRVVFRNTQDYSFLLDNSYHPQLLGDVLLRDTHFSQIKSPDFPVGLRDDFYKAEIEDLWRGDIPSFNTKINSRDLYHHEKRRFKHVFPHSAWQKMQQRLLNFSHSDLRQQQWLIESTFSLYQAADDDHQLLTCETASPNIDSFLSDSIQKQQVESTVSDLLQKIDELSWVDSENGRLWFGIRQQDSHTEVAPMDFDLYAGQTGIVLSLAYLGKLDKNQTAAHWAMQGAHYLLNNIDVYRRARHIGIGAFTGLSGLVYCFTHLGHLWGEEKWLAAGKSLITTIESRISEDRTFDLVGGSAGAILALLPLYQTHPSDLLKNCLLTMANHLRSNALQQEQGVAWVPEKEFPQPLLGFSHGNAGIALALTRLSAVLKSTEYLALIQQCLDYESLHFSKINQNWPDFRFETTDGSQNFLSAWAHGAAGIGWSRCEIQQTFPELELNSEIDASVITTLEFALGQGHCLSQGDLGNLGFIQTVSDLRNDQHLSSVVRKHVHRIITDINARGVELNTLNNLPTPGLMTGLCGVAYQLQKLTLSPSLPNLLNLEGPNYES
jgi:type 2 lantibiotic biosynthesis protein LanM